MKNVNELVQAVRTEGKESMEYAELFTTVMTETIEPKAESFGKQLKGDVASGIDEGIKLFMELVDTWNGTGNFHSLFKTAYANRLKNHVKYLNRDKRKHNTSYDISLSGVVEGTYSESSVTEVIVDDTLNTSFDITEEKGTLEKLIDAFSLHNKEQGDLINIMLSFPEDAKTSDYTKAYIEYFGVQVYAGVPQKKVSRAKNDFKKFLQKNNYEGVIA